MQPTALAAAFDASRRYRPAQIVALAGLLFLAAYAGGLIVRPSHGYLRIQSNLVYNFAPFAALCLSVIPIRKSSGRERLGWIFLAILLVTWQAGDWTFSYYNLLRGSDPPFPGFADAAYYVGYVAFIAAIPLLMFPRRLLNDRRWLFDPAVITVIAATIGWEYIMRPILADGGGSGIGAGVALGYPVFDLAILTVLMVTLYASGARYSTLALVLAGAAVFQVVSDSAYTYAQTTTGYNNAANPVELGWLGAYLLMAVCFVLPAESLERSEGQERHGLSAIGLALPYLFGAPLLALLLLSAVQGKPSLVLLSGTIAVIGLIVSRQALTLRGSFASLVRAAYFDDLTELPNRRRFEERGNRHLARDRRQRTKGALLLLGLDDMKAVNDTLGRLAGDSVLVRAGNTFQSNLDPDDGLARLEGDEFAMRLSNIEPLAAEATARALLAKLHGQPMVLSGQLVRVSASAGIAVFPDDGRTVDELLHNAGLAIHDAKAAGGNRVCVYDQKIHNQARPEARLAWKERISGALEEDRFLLYCQPIVDLKTGGVFEYEALLRMVGEDGQILEPTAFLDIAERFGLIDDIDRWVVHRAIGLLARHQHADRAFRLSVNLSGKAFGDAELLRLIRQELASARVDPALLTFEVTETAAIADLDRAQDFISSLKELGCRFALDDFGVGFSSFSQLKHLKVDYLKIDGSFVRDLPRDEVDQRLVKTMVDLAHALGHETIAEYVRDEETAQLLRTLGADYGQGYYFGRPVRGSDMFNLGRHHPPDSAQRNAA